ncbi:MAG: hypothetical protein REI64_07320 [Pedobacter sp.]|uniref:hypothetical protein n=1 Tax=Pedobacter sp. TaxID=1411316 RepID=UPI0028088E67|nr:hypothetical protein [Pedobacter sp.]MDQ8004596.1 hypothetical protein [Pedobacter sp.]
MGLGKFIVSYLLYTLLLAGISIAIKHFFPEAIAGQFWLVFGFLAGLTLIAYILADIGIKRNPQIGVFAILGSVIIKMLFAMSFVLIYSLKQTKGDMAFALNFFSLYLLFTLFEILGLLRNLRHQNK